MKPHADEVTTDHSTSGYTQHHAMQHTAILPHITTTTGTWSSSRIERMLLWSIAVSVQRGNALAMLSGFTRLAGAQAGVLGQGRAQSRAELIVERGGDCGDWRNG